MLQFTETLATAAALDIDMDRLMDMDMDAPGRPLRTGEQDKVQADLAWKVKRAEVVGLPAEYLDIAGTVSAPEGECIVHPETACGPVWGWANDTECGHDCGYMARVCSVCRALGETGAPVCQDMFAEPVKYMVPSLATVGYGHIKARLSAPRWSSADTYMDRTAVYVHTDTIDLSSGRHSPEYPHGSGIKCYVFRGRNDAGKVRYYTAPAYAAVQEIESDPDETCTWERAYYKCKGDGATFEGRSPGSAIE